MNIGVFDSGIGGLTVLEELVKELPQCNFIFYGDQKNNPYGEKSDEELLKITSEIVDYLNEKDCKIIVIACNTATTRCRNRLIEKYPDNVFIGTVPAVKVACDNNFKNTLVLATPATIESERLHQIVDENIREDQNIYLVPCYGLADAIEQNDVDKIERILSEIAEEYANKEIDSIVLGCTHYPFIKDRIARYMPEAVLLDGSKGVARETRHQLTLNDLMPEDNEKGTLEVVFTKK
ncbi:MAG: glutamate racemase [Erysipelotrichaceae bacterium]|nr:glutamate racemase [Erysipelotrichaceae bacterium]